MKSTSNRMLLAGFLLALPGGVAWFDWHQARRM
jgi:hypothetical protein